MKVLLLIAMFAGIASPQTTDAPYDWETDSSVGHLPEIVVTAPRYEFEDEAWSGLMDTMVISATRYGVLNGELSGPRASRISFSTILALFSIAVLGVYGFRFLYRIDQKYNKIPEMVYLRCNGGKCHS